MEHPIPDTALETPTAIIGRTGAGKTFAAKGAVEHLLAANRRVCIIDPTGAWWGLRLEPKGKRPSGFAVVILGGDHADIPIQPSSGDKLGELIAAATIPQCVVDISGFSNNEATWFLTDLFETVYSKNRAPLHLVMDEADMMAPQNPMPEARRLQGAVNKIVRRGRIKGFRPLMITQRPQVIDKSVLSQIDTLVAMRLTSPQDRKAIQEWVKGHSSDAEAKQVMDSLASLGRGEGWVWSPDHDILQRAKFPVITTFDSSRAPEVGEETVAPVPFAEMDLAGIRAQLAPPKNEEEEPAAKGGKADLKALKEAEQRGYERGFEAGRVEGFKEGRSLGHRQGAHSQMRRVIEAIATAPMMNGDSAALAAFKLPKIDFGAEAPANTSPAKQPRTSATAASPPAKQRANSNGTGSQMPPGEKAVLVAAAQYGAVERDQLSILTGYKRSSRDAYIARLVGKGLATTEGRSIRPTPAGIEALGSDYELLPTGVDLQNYWLDRLPPGEKAVIEVLIAADGCWIERSTIDEATGYKRSSRDAYIARLKARRLVEVTSAGVRASEVLFA